MRSREEDKDMRKQGWGTYLVLCSTFIVAAGLWSSCSSGGGSTPAVRIPINTATGWSDSPSISRDGQRLYFMYSRYDFGPWIISGGATLPVPSGPDRPGLHHSANPWDESDIYMATRNPDGTWSEAVNLGLNGAYGDASGMEIDGGNTFIWLHGNGAGNDIVMASKALDGTWNTPVDLGPGVNDHTAGVFQDNPHLSPNGLGLWFTSNRAGDRDIWFSLYSNGSWSTPVNMGAPFSEAGDDDQIWIDPAVTATPEIYWNASDGLKRCIWNESTSTCAAPPEIVTIPGCVYAAEASITDDGQYLYFGCGDPATGRVKIMYSVKQLDGSWGTATPVD